MTPDEDVLVLSKESRKCLADMQTGEGVDLSHLFRSRIFEKYFFKFFNGLCYCSLVFYVHGFIDDRPSPTLLCNIHVQLPDFHAVLLLHNR